MKKFTILTALLLVTVFATAQNVGVNTTSPGQALDVEGKIEIGDDTAPPTAGAVRFNSANNDLECWNGEEWLSLTKSNIHGGWGSTPSANENQKVTASDAATSDQFGFSVAIDGEWAIVGAYLDDDNGVNSGSAYVFQRSGTTWTEQAKLTASDGEEIDYLGGSVAIDGDWAIVGAYLDDDNGSNSGSAYVFQRSGTTWTEQAKLTASDGAGGDQFGFSVAIDGDWAIVGAHLDDDNGSASGSAYVFQRSGTTWTEQTKLTASDGAGYYYFGISVAIDADWAIVGAYLDDDNGASSGSAYVFQRSGTTWTEQTKLTASDGAADDSFGYSVAIDGEWAIVGAYYDDDNGSNSGSAYVFQRSGTTWAEQAKLTASDGAVDDFFGLSVAIDGRWAVLGSAYNDDNGSNSGSAYIFQRTGTTWTEQAKLIASDAAGSDQFGRSVAIDSGSVLVGSYGDDDNGASSGSVYFFGQN